MKRTSQRVWALIVLLVLTVAAAGCGSKKDAGPATKPTADKPKQTIKIAYLPITHALPLYVEKELVQQDFEGVDLELIKFGSWPELLDALNTGQVDGASVLVELAMRAKEQNIDLKALALGHRDGNVVVAANNINTAADLKAKNIAIPHRLSTHNILLHKLLKNNHLTERDVKVVELPPPEMPAALAEGRISAYIVAEPFGAKSVALGKGKVLYQSGDLWPDSVCCALVLRNDLIRQHPEAVQEFVNGYAKAGAMAETRNEKVYALASQYLNADPKVLDLSLQWISYNDLKLKEKDYEALRQNLIEMGLSPNPPSYADFVDNAFIDRVK